jgi:hypothetical protein
MLRLPNAQDPSPVSPPTHALDHPSPLKRGGEARGLEGPTPAV